ncbi:MAG: hypothetical protein AB8I08_32145 [Sandaracinaceae bacterium]
MRMWGLEAVLWVAVVVLPGGVLLSPLLVVVVRRRRASISAAIAPGAGSPDASSRV